MMAKMDTKEKILLVAEELFAEKGYEGTSLRDIATQADVNLSGIAYHFKNKESLYWNVFLGSHQWLESEIKGFVEREDNLKDVMWNIFEFLYENSKSLRNAFMIMLSDSFPTIEEDIKEELMKTKQMGPPGAIYLVEIIRKEVGPEVPEERIMWAVETLFSHTIHWALLMSGKGCKQIYENHPMFELEARKRSSQMHCEAILSSLKSR